MGKKPLNYFVLFARIGIGVLLLIFTTGVMRANPAIEQQQKKTITGKVSDKNGEEIIGASVVVKNTTNGTVTDPDGIFSLRNVSEGETVTISYIGFLTQEFKVGNQAEYAVTLMEDSKALNEVVVVGYGVQKKVNLTGSVASVDMNEIVQGRPITNVSNGLAGLVPGLQVISANNRPGNDNSSLLIRGQGTLNNAAPLVLIDGMEGNISNINPQDIENISVLKDAASASIYGSRAANGVILITTKQGKKGAVKIAYNGYLSWESLGKTFTPVSNYADYMQLINEGYINSNQPSIFSQDKIDLWRANEKGDHLLYPNTNWIDATFKTSLSTNHTISLSGGSDKTNFFTSFGFMDNPGLMENSGYKKYDMRANLETDVTSWLKLGTNLNGFVAYTQPGTDAIDNAFIYGSATTPGMVFRAPDGRYGAMNNMEDDPQAASNNLLRRLNSVKGNYVRRNAKARFFGTLSPFKGFTLNGSYNYEILDDQRHSQPVFIDGWNFLTNTITNPGGGRTSVTESNYKTERNFMDAFANYDINFFENKLNMHVLAGASQEQYAYYWFSGSKMDLLDPDLGVINGGTSDMSASGNRIEWAMRSYFGRLNFNWDSKYLLEANIRADASSRFMPNKRWGYFPSFSAGWRINQEAFMEGLSSKGLSNLKLRASYGELGNNALYSDQNLGNYEYLSTYTQTNYILNNALAMGLSQTAIANANLTWETGKVTDFGVDFGFLKNRLNGTIDYFNRETVDILIDLPAPGVHGNASIPKQNSATMTNRGLELSLNWTDKIGDFSYAVSGNVSWLKNKVSKFKGNDYSLSGASMIKAGLPYNVQYVMIVDRIIQTDADLAYVQQIIDNAPIDPATGKPKDPFATIKRPGKGDLLYKDVNGDGLINDDDRVTVGNGPNPNFIYGLTLSANYKGFDFSALLQGLGGVKMVYSDTYFTPNVRWGYQIDKTIADGRWQEGRTDATYPRLLVYSDTRNTINSNFWMQNKSFLKIRNIQLGYTIPQVFTSKAHVDKLRVYGSLENFFTFTSYIGMDPEVTNTAYPSMRQAVVGINLTF